MKIFRIINQFIKQISRILILKLATIRSRNHNSIRVSKEKLRGTLKPIYKRG